MIGHEAKAIKKVILIDNQRFRWVENEAYLSGQSTSLKVGIESLQEQQSNIMVFLGDLPFISAETIRLIYKTGMDKMKETDEGFSIGQHIKDFWASSISRK